MENTFKIGDYIIGKAGDGSKSNPYLVTCEGWRGVVSDVRESGLIEVQPIRTVDNELTDEEYVVRPEYFDKCTKFLVGDIVVGNNDSGVYFITKKGWKGEVTKLFEDGEITVTELVASGTHKRLKFDVDPEYFDLVEPAEYVKKPKQASAESHKQFKVGDIVVGNELADDRYRLTKTGWKGKVVVSTDEYGQFKAVRADNPDGVKFSLNSDYFDLCEDKAPAQTYKVTIQYTEGAKQASYTVTKGLSTLDDKTVSFKNESSSIGAIVRRIADKIKDEETKYSTLCVGDRVVVTKNTGRHAFKVGQIVQCNNATIPTFKRDSDGLVQSLDEDEYIEVID